MLVAQSCLTLVTPWAVACQAPLSVGFPRQEHWSGLPFPSPGDPPTSPTLQADSLPLSHQGSPKNPIYSAYASLPFPTRPLTATDLMDCRLSVSSAPGILQARIPEWVAMPFSRGSALSRGWTPVSYVSCTGRLVLYHQCYLGSPLSPWISLYQNLI